MYEISKFSEISRFHSRFQDFTRDFKISLEISRFHSRFQDFTRDFKISLEISRFHSRFQDSLEISLFHSRFQDFTRDFKISQLRFQHPSYTLFVSFNASASMNESYSSRFVFRYGTALTARCVTAMGLWQADRFKSLIIIPPLNRILDTKK